MKQNVVCNKNLALLALRLGLADFLLISDHEVIKKSNILFDHLD